MSTVNKAPEGWTDYILGANASGNLTALVFLLGLLSFLLGVAYKVT